IAFFLTMGHSRSVSAPDGPRLPSQPIIRRFELRNKSYSRTNFEPATREASAAPAASSLPLIRAFFKRERDGLRVDTRALLWHDLPERVIFGPRAGPGALLFFFYPLPVCAPGGARSAHTRPR